MKQQIKKSVVIMLSLLLVLGGCSADEKTSIQTDVSSFSDQTDESLLEKEKLKEELRQGETFETDKEESVYVKADSSGNVKEIEVEVTLHNSKDNEPIRDVSSLTDIKNTQGDEEFTWENDELIWENKGEDIYYKGVGSEELPVGLKISYFLDEEPISPQKLAGQSGKVRIRFDYYNNTAQTVQVNGKTIAAVNPFVIIQTVFLDEDVFFNVEVKNGKVMELDGQKVVIGLAVPEVSNYLKLADLEATEAIEIPEMVEISADVVDFKLDFTSAFVTNGLFTDLQQADLDDFYDQLDDLTSLSDASGKLREGSEALADGSAEIRKAVSAYIDGVSAAAKGIAMLDEGIAAMDSQKEALQQGASMLSEGLKTLDNSLSQLDGEALKETETMLRGNFSKLGEDVYKLQVMLSALQSVFIADAQQIASLQSGIDGAIQAIEGIDLGSDNITSVLINSLEQTQLSEEEKQQILAEVSAAVVQREQELQLQLDEVKESLQASREIDAAGEFDFEALSELLEEIGSEFAQLGGFIENSGLSESDQLLVETLLESVKQLSIGASQLEEGINAFCTGVETLAQGSSQLLAASDPLQQYGTAIKTGMQSLDEGIIEFKDGVVKFDEEGIQKLCKLFGSDIRGLLERVEALKKADELYETYSGLAEGKSGRVTFVIETEEIE